MAAAVSVAVHDNRLLVSDLLHARGVMAPLLPVDEAVRVVMHHVDLRRAFWFCCFVFGIRRWGHFGSIFRWLFRCCRRRLAWRLVSSVGRRLGPAGLGSWFRVGADGGKLPRLLDGLHHHLRISTPHHRQLLPG